MPVTGLIVSPALAEYAGVLLVSHERVYAEMLEVYNVAVFPLLARDKLLCAVVKQAVAVERLAAVPLRYRDNYLDKPVVAVGVVLVAVYQREVEQAVLLVSGNFSSESFLRTLYALLVVDLLRLYLYLAEVKTYARFALVLHVECGGRDYRGYLFVLGSIGVGFYLALLGVVLVEGLVVLARLAYADERDIVPYSVEVHCGILVAAQAEAAHLLVGVSEAERLIADVRHGLRNSQRLYAVAAAERPVADVVHAVADSNVGQLAALCERLKTDEVKVAEYRYGIQTQRAVERRVADVVHGSGDGVSALDTAGVRHELLHILSEQHAVHGYVILVSRVAGYGRHRAVLCERASIYPGHVRRNADSLKLGAALKRPAVDELQGIRQGDGFQIFAGVEAVPVQ